METIEKESQGKGKQLAKKGLIKVDMTPMVDLGFLLITFFMFTTNFSKPSTIDLKVPPNGDNTTEIDIRNSVTFILGKNNKVYYYQKDIGNLTSSDLMETSLDNAEVSNVIDVMRKKAPNPQIFIVIVKPSEDANYKQFVDMLDEISINSNVHYGISDLKDVEKQMYVNKIN